MVVREHIKLISKIPYKENSVIHTLVESFNLILNFYLNKYFFQVGKIEYKRGV
jgi:hypothetical protein